MNTCIYKASYAFMDQKLYCPFGDAKIRKKIHQSKSMSGIFASSQQKGAKLKMTMKHEQNWIHNWMRSKLIIAVWALRQILPPCVESKQLLGNLLNVLLTQLYVRWWESCQQYLRYKPGIKPPNTLCDILKQNITTTICAFHCVLIHTFWLCHLFLPVKCSLWNWLKRYLQ